MPRNRRPNRRRTQPPIQTAPLPPKRSLPGWVWATIVAGSVVVAYIAFWPRVTIDPEGDIDPANPSRISFKVTNTGFISLQHVKAFMGLCTIYTGEPINLPDRCDKIRARLFLPQWNASTLRRDEPETIRLDENFKFTLPAKLGAADISIGATFTPWYLPIPWEIEYRFQTHVESDGKLSWIRRPLDK